MSLLRAFVDNLPAARRAGLAEEDADLTSELEGSLDRARSTWSNVTLDEELWGRALAQRVGAGSDVGLAQGVRELHTGDLFLALACAEGSPAALAHFQRVFEPALRALLLRTGLSSPDADDALQGLRETLFVGDPIPPPRVLGYGARSELRWWLRAVATRTGVRLRRAEQKKVGIVDSQLAGGGDQELAYFRRVYGAAFEVAFREAWRALEAKERLLLAQRLRHQLSLTELGTLHGVHESTISRWVAAARERLLEDTRARMMQTLNVGRAEISSMMRLIESAVDISISA